MGNAGVWVVWAHGGVLGRSGCILRKGVFCSSFEVRLATLQDVRSMDCNARGKCIVKYL